MASWLNSYKARWLLNHMTDAMQASLEENQSEQKQTAYANELMRRGASDEPASTSTMGLRNATGEYNCFLNVIIQCLWHCRVFRQSVMDWHPAAFEVTFCSDTSLAAWTACLVLPLPAEASQLSLCWLWSNFCFQAVLCSMYNHCYLALGPRHMVLVAILHLLCAHTIFVEC